MDLTNLTFFKMAQKKMDWVSQRQAVLASNIANSDTPDFKASDLKEVDFSKELKTGSVTMATTNPMHISNGVNSATSLVRTNASHILPKYSKEFREEEQRSFETSIDDNGVVLEEQLEKLSGNRTMYNIATTLYKKNYNMIGASLGKNLK